ncbi:hypothetical protein GJAV_G00107640 [Gymnothorax javanicus]|nr:hypothetical protein GJAV_G00107640 [Gymnothorax javanicus]
MSNQEIFYLSKMNMEEILSMKFALKQKEILEPVLSSNMDFAAREIMYMDPALLAGASLFISGESVLVKFLPNPCVSSPRAQQIRNRIRFTVMSNDGQPQLIRRVTCDDLITDSDMKAVHFSGHRCQDRVKSCFEQAREIVSQHNTLAVLHIICNGLSLTYSVNDDATEGQNGAIQSPQSTQQSAVTCYTIKTRCRFSFQGPINIERLLEVRCWLEEEKPQKRGLITCIDHLLKQVGDNPYFYLYNRVILQNNGEIVELVAP